MLNLHQQVQAKKWIVMCVWLGNNAELKLRPFVWNARSTCAIHVPSCTRVWRWSVTHHLSTIGDPSTMEAIKNKVRIAFCDKHPKDEIKFYLSRLQDTVLHDMFHCKTQQTWMLWNWGKLLKNSRKVSNNIPKMWVNSLPSLNNSLKKSIDNLLHSRSVSTLPKRKFLETGEAIKRMVDMHTQAVIADLNSHKTHFLKTHLSTKEELQRNMMMCESFVSYCQKAIEEADAVESIRMADELRTRAEKLKEERITELVKLPNIQFLPSDVAINLHNSFGNIHGKYSMLFTHSCPITRFLPQN